jgi:radical SAM superfamily enzyme YgiQ (UPF0313 family)
MNNFSDDELILIRSSGCCSVFMGAETGNNDLLQKINKGPSSAVSQTLEVVSRFKSYDIIPELSFVFGFPESCPTLSLGFSRFASTKQPFVTSSSRPFADGHGGGVNVSII